MEEHSSTDKAVSLSLFCSKTGQTSLSISSTSSSDDDDLSRSSGGRSVEGVPNREVVPAADVIVFTLSELRKATRNFQPNSLVGEGGFGRVFKGYLDEGHSHARGRIPIAIKKLNSESVQGFKEWKVFHPLSSKIFLVSCFSSHNYLFYHVRLYSEV